MERKHFELRILFSCNEDVAGKVNDDVMEKRCNFLGDGVAHCFEFNRLDAASIDVISLTQITEVKNGEVSSSN